MLPLPTSSRSSSPTLPSTPLGSPPLSSKLAIHSLPASLRPYALRLRALHRSHPSLSRALSLSLALLFLAAFLSLSRLWPFSGPKVAHAPLAWGTHPDAILNYGDYVGLGQARQKVLDATPRGYADVSDKIPWLDKVLDGPLYRSRRSRREREQGKEAVRLGKEGKRSAGGRRAEMERHGTLGGASVEWSTGVVGSGTYLGPVDMRKDPPSSSSSSSSSSADDDPSTTSPALAALTSHILSRGWEFLDEEDRLNTLKLHSDARAKGFLASLPLRERVRDSEKGRREASEGWARIYAAEASGGGGGVKSALEVQLERLVRRAPVVVFSKTTCPHSRRAKELLSSLDLFPPPHIIEVDLRPDAPTLKALLARRTLHHTFPNIVIGSRSIGGADDLEALLAEGEGEGEGGLQRVLQGVLEEVGVRVRGEV
ncbi:hypothetical protein JCM6882_004340 [Rhodosporidiobolus microsporus]